MKEESPCRRSSGSPWPLDPAAPRASARDTITNDNTTRPRTRDQQAPWHLSSKPERFCRAGRRSSTPSSISRTFRPTRRNTWTRCGRKSLRSSPRRSNKTQQIAAQAAERGRQAALEAARKAALEDLTSKWQTLAPALQQAIDDTAQLRSSWLRHWEQQVIHLAVAVAERLVRGELSRRPDISQQWIREALELASSSHTLTLRLNPADYEALGSLRESARQ